MTIPRIFILILLSSLFTCEKDVPVPIVDSVEPVAAPAEELITIQGQHLANIESITFSGQVINFNTAFNADHALLMRVPTNVPTGEHEVVITTAGGTATFDFKVTLDPPAIFSISPESAVPGDIITIKGKNFFEPLEVYFFDEVAAEIVTATPDSILVQVPEGVEKGRVTVVANGGTAISPRDFFSVNRILINDFDGNGMRPMTDRWIFVGEVEQTPNTAVFTDNPAGIDGAFLKLSGTDNFDISWIGGAQTDFGFPGDTFTNFGIRTSAGNTFLELDVNNNGRDNTHILLILLEHEGSNNDFVEEIHLDGNAGWERLSIPLTRFIDIDNEVVDPAKVKTLKIHLIDEDDSNTTLEINVDNISFKEVL